jgi:hypothetical protein
MGDIVLAILGNWFRWENRPRYFLRGAKSTPEDLFEDLLNGYDELYICLCNILNNLESVNPQILIELNFYIKDCLDQWIEIKKALICHAVRYARHAEGIVKQTDALKLTQLITMAPQFNELMRGLMENGFSNENEWNAAWHLLRAMAQLLEDILNEQGPVDEEEQNNHPSSDDKDDDDNQGGSNNNSPGSAGGSADMGNSNDGADSGSDTDDDTVTDSDTIDEGYGDGMSESFAFALKELPSVKAQSLAFDLKQVTNKAFNEKTLDQKAFVWGGATGIMGKFFP